MEFKKFIAIWMIVWFSFAFALSGFQAIFPNRQNNTMTYNSQNHFSVRWMGFLPSFNNQYPDYYVAINNLAGDSWIMGIGFQIKNQENKSYYFLIGQNATPPAGWTLPSVNLGLIGVDQTLTFTYNANRTKITSISQGTLVEQIPLVVKAFHDSSYTQLYSEDSFNVTFRFLDYASTAWSNLYIDNFDAGTTQGWSSGSTPYFIVEVSNTYYRSYPYALRLWNNYGVTTEGALRKSFVVAAGYSEAYLVFSLRSTQYYSPGVRIYYSGTQYFGMNAPPSVNTWYQFAVPLPVGQTTLVDIYCAYGTTGTSAWLDDVYVVAK